MRLWIASFDDYQPLFSISSELDLLQPMNLKQRPGGSLCKFQELLSGPDL